MPTQAFTKLFGRYPDVIDAMPQIFDSHQFILELARRYQGPYTEALSGYSRKPAPFQIVHGILAGHLNACTELVQRVGNVISADIFGNQNQCAQWRKL